MRAGVDCCMMGCNSISIISFIIISIIVIRIPHNHRGTIIPVHAIEKTTDIKGHDIAVLQWPTIGNAVTNDFVNRRAERFGKTGVIEGRGVGVLLNQTIVTEDIQVFRGDAGLGVLEDDIQGGPGELRGGAHLIDTVIIV